MRNLIIIVGAALIVSGCGQQSPCAGVSGACIGAHISGSVSGLEQLVIGVDQPAPGMLRTPSTPAPIKLPARVALALAAGARGTVAVTIDGLDQRGVSVAHAAQRVALPASGHIDVDITLAPGGVGVDLGGTVNVGSDLGGVDLGGVDLGAVDLGAVNLGPDLATSIVFSGAADTRVNELDPLTLTLVTSDAQSNDLVLTASGVPATATFTAAGASATLTWTPAFSEAGAYPITLTATSASNPAYSASQAFTITVVNTIDPMLNAAATDPDQVALDPVGDVDGDGLADFAQCSITTSGAAPQYTVQVVYGDKSGLPPVRPYPADRTRAITFAAPAGASHLGDTQGTLAASCAGGDFDGDGKSDVILGDPSYLPPGSATVVGTYWIVYGASRSDASPAVTAELSPGGSDTLGDLPAVGDWDGDGIIDLAALQRNVPPPGASVSATIYVWQGAAARQTGIVPSQTLIRPHLCGNLQLMGFATSTGAIDAGGKKPHALVWYDGAVTSSNTLRTSGSCAANDGGIGLIASSMQGTQLLWMPWTPTAQAPAPVPLVCDVDGDGKDDLVALTNSAGTYSVSVVYGSATGWPAPLDLSKSAVTMVKGNGPALACWKSAYGPSAFAVGDPGKGTSVGYTGLSSVFLYTVDGTGVPMASRTLTNFATDPSFRGFGVQMHNAGDVNGDGAADLVIDYRLGKATPLAWLLYGRK